MCITVLRIGSDKGAVFLLALLSGIIFRSKEPVITIGLTQNSVFDDIVIFFQGVVVECP